MSGQILDQWLTAKKADVGRHALSVMAEANGARVKILDDLRLMVQDHYVAPDVTAKRIAELGAPQTAELLREHLPKSKKIRSGDLGEILATEIAERHLGCIVPIRRLRWKDGRDMALRGDDLVGLRQGRKRKIQFLKGESKSRAQLAQDVIDEAANALDRDIGRPTRHSVLFIAERLREQGEDDLARELEQAVLQSFQGYTVEHLLFALSGNNPESLLSQHLKECEKKKRRRHAVGVHISDHAAFIAEVFEAS
ncbi:MAG: SAVED domain-containing protein (plasmid) [Candidatus Manganitrophus sp.]|nr:DUF1837 domain-containing protein [Candidatus Manganitrophus morganii]MDC4207168.1 SAVED domain-containing protein [Candidatus Manganitrophus sp.]MDC4228170.1 SAVED domain-containing protein [Candidatus Manganitrophus sp.]WDT73581.1 MAG: SAVED domain-containing protein [Candidatus Manganitrophus sp.]WDT82877.1 MAG: SAVED domain-containing protein [Candidatus Manganitrophus sp.]